LSERQTDGTGLAVLGILFQETKEEKARDFIREFAVNRQLRTRQSSKSVVLDQTLAQAHQTLRTVLLDLGRLRD